MHNQERELAIGRPIRAQAAGAIALVEKRGATDALLSAIRLAAGQAGKSSGQIVSAYLLLFSCSFMSCGP